MASEVQLGSTYLDIDPDTYTLIGGARRGSVHRLIEENDDGAMTIYQDRGINQDDLVLQFTGKLINVDTLKAVATMWRQTGGIHDFRDFKGNYFRVVFTPGIESFATDVIKGSNRGYTYRISLSVVEVIDWFSDNFPSNS